MAAKREGAGAKLLTVKLTATAAPLQVGVSNVQVPGVTSPSRLPCVMARPPTKKGMTKVARQLPPAATRTLLHSLGWSSPPGPRTNSTKAVCAVRRSSEAQDTVPCRRSGAPPCRPTLRSGRRRQGRRGAPNPTARAGHASPLTPRSKGARGRSPGDHFDETASRFEMTS